VLCLVAAGGWRLYTSPWLVISTVRVTGAQTLDPDDLRDTAGITGQRFFTANTAAAAKRLLALPRVKSATVTVRPPRSATIAVVERQPAGVWAAGGVIYVVDGDGVVLDTTNDPGGLPIVDATGSSVDLRVGGRVDPDALLIATRAARFAPSAIGQHVARVQYGRDTGATVLTDRGTLVHLGDSNDLDYKLSVWQQVVATINPADLHELDLRDGDRPYYR
jgi:cell division protein FtsQ